MMSNKMAKRLLSLALCGTMVMGMGATAVNAEENEPITLTWGVYDVQVKEAGVLSEKSEIWKRVEEELGITVELVTYDVEKYNVLAAGGDFPDILSTCMSGTSITDIIDAGQLLPLDDLLAEYGQNITNNISYAIDKVNSAFDATYVLPVGVDNQMDYPSSNGYFGAFHGRYDVYKAIGSPEIDGLDGLLEVAKQMQDYERERTGRDDIYAFSDSFADGMGNILGYFYLGSENMSSGLQMNLTTFDTSCWSIDPDSATYQIYEFYNKAYRMGIFDPDSLLMNYDQYSTKIQNGSTLFSACWDFDLNEGVAVPEYEDYAGLYLLPGSVEFLPFLYGRLNPTGYTVDSARTITSNCKYPERAMQLLNWLDSQEGGRAMYSGEEGVTWEYNEEGVPVYNEASMEAMKNGDTEYWADLRLRYYGTPMMSSMTAIKTEDGYSVNVAQSATFLENNTVGSDKAFAEDFGCAYPGQVYEKWIEEGTLTTDVYSEEYATALANNKAVMLSNESSAIYSEVQNNVAANVSKLLLADSDEAFDQAVADLIEANKDLGMESVAEEAYAQLDAMDWGEFTRK